MRWLPVLCYLGIAAWQVGTHLDVFFPSDPVQRHALQQCLAEDYHFNPLDQAARANCLKAHVPVPMPQPMQHANFVDLWRSQGQGPMTGNDILR